MKDHWRHEPDEGGWVRVHVKPRRSLFTPAGVAGGPEAGRLTHSRRTVVTRADEPTEIVDDDWVGPDAHRLLPREWVGETWFYDAAVSPPVAQASDGPASVPREYQPTEVDSWRFIADMGVWVRDHRRMRTSLFSPRRR